MLFALFFVGAIASPIDLFRQPTTNAIIPRANGDAAYAGAINWYPSSNVAGSITVPDVSFDPKGAVTQLMDSFLYLAGNSCSSKVQAGLRTIVTKDKVEHTVWWSSNPSQIDFFPMTISKGDHIWFQIYYNSDKTASIFAINSNGQRGYKGNAPLSSGPCPSTAAWFMNDYGLEKGSSYSLPRYKSLQFSNIWSANSDALSNTDNTYFINQKKNGKQESNVVKHGSTIEIKQV